MWKIGKIQPKKSVTISSQIFYLSLSLLSIINIYRHKEYGRGGEEDPGGGPGEPVEVLAARPGVLHQGRRARP